MLNSDNNFKKIVKYLIIIITLVLCYQFLWLSDIILVKIYDFLTKQETVNKFIKSDFDFIKFEDLPLKEKSKYKKRTCKSFHYEHQLFIKITWFDRYKNIIDDLKPYQLLTPDRLIMGRIKIPNLAKTQYLLINPEILKAYHELMLKIKENDKLNEKAISVTSGFRNPSYNKFVGGAICSQHQVGTAIDISVGDLNMDGKINNTDRKIIYNLLNKEIIANHGGLGKYKNSPRLIHFDVRGHRARW